MASWRFYDFDAHWDEFYEIWKRDYVQDVFEYDINRFNQKMNEELKCEVYTWTRGDPVWEINHNYWDIHAWNLGDAEIEKNADFYEIEKRTYKKRMETILMRKYTDGQIEELFTSNYLNPEVYDKYRPKDDTVESLYFDGVRGPIVRSLYIVATETFPSDPDITVLYLRSHKYCVVTIPSEKIVMDLEGFIKVKHEGQNNYLDDILENITDYHDNGYGGITMIPFGEDDSEDDVSGSEETE